MEVTNSTFDELAVGDGIEVSRLVTARDVELFAVVSDRTRYIFLLHRYRGLSRSRIAEHLGLPATVVDSHIDEAMGSIKHAVSEFSALGVSWRQGH